MRIWISTPHCCIRSRTAAARTARNSTCTRRRRRRSRTRSPTQGRRSWRRRGRSERTGVAAPLVRPLRSHRPAHVLHERRRAHGGEIPERLGGGWAYTGRVWSPLDYANPVWFVRERALHGVPPAVLLALPVWALPFIWIGVGMSVRRAADAGLSPWLALLFFIPFVNYLLMLGLCIPDSNQRRIWRTEPTSVPPLRNAERGPGGEAVLNERWRSGLLGVAGALRSEERR